MRKILYFLRQLGFDPIKTIKSGRNFPKYMAGLVQLLISRPGLKKIRISPVLNDFHDAAGASDGHYFWQDLICAKWIFSDNPDRHLDIGSRLDGFIAHLLTFREVVLLDIRPITTNIPNLSYIAGNAQGELPEHKGQFDSVSSLHSIEHFGLGRYGDPIDIAGHIKGLKNIAECVEPMGKLYISFPIGEEMVEFNEQRIISPTWPVEQLTDFILKDFVLIPWRGAPIYGLMPGEVNLSIKGQAGMYKFERKNEK